MRYPKDHKESTRRHIVGSAAKTFRRDGIVASGVVGLMAEAGFTQGGFYTHFSSKDALVEEALQIASAETRRGFSKTVALAREEGRHPILAVIDNYLSDRHLEAREKSCIFSALGAELARLSEPPRRSAQRGMAEMIDVIAAELPPKLQDRAAPLLALLSGMLQLARLAGTRAEREELLSQGRRAARLLVGVDPAE